jgi:hypothetical protein
MKKGFLRTVASSFALVLITTGISFGQAGTVRTQNAWARPILKLNGTAVPAGTTLLPNTNYTVSLQALPPIASDNLGNPVLNILYIQDGDGFVPSTAGGYSPGVDVPVPGGRGYQGDIVITTNDQANLPPQIYIRYRGVTFEIDPATNIARGTPTIRIQQALLP